MLEYDIQVRLQSSPGVTVDLVPASNISFTTVDGEAAVLTVTVSEVLAGELPTPFYADVQLLNGDVWVSPRNNLYVFHDKDGDDRDPAGMRSLTGVLYVADRGGRHYITDSITDDTVVWSNASAGGVMSSLLTTLVPDTGIDANTFSATLDSYGQPWAAADKTDHTARPWSSVGQVLSSLAQGGYCQWWTEGTELILVRPGSGVDRTQLSIEHGATSLPVRESTVDTASEFFVVTDTDVPTQRVTRPQLGAGHRQAIVTVSGATTKEAALRMAQPIIDAASQVRREYSLMFDAANLPARPLIDFQIGDIFTVKGNHYRLVGVQITRSEGGVGVRLTFGERFLGLLARIQRRTAQISFGSLTMTGGSGQPIPPGVVKPKAEPDAPRNLTLVTNAGGMRPNGASYALIELEWDTVTQTVFGADTRVTEYEVWVRQGDASAVPIASVTEPRFEAEWSLDERYVSVRAYNGSWSDFSDELRVVPAAPVQVTAALTMPQLESAFGVVVVEWDGNNVLGEVGPEFNIGYVDVAAAAAGPWTRYGAGFSDAGQVATLRGTAGLDMFVRFVWADTLGRIGSTSAVASITVVGVTPGDLDSIPDFFANEAVIQNARVGILKAGVIEVDMLAPNVGEQINITANEGLLVVTDRVDDLERAGQYYRFGPNGAIIGRIDDPVTFNFRNDGASFDVNGVPATTWGPGGMDAPRMSSDEAVIGNLLFEKSGNRTVVRVVQT